MDVFNVPLISIRIAYGRQDDDRGEYINSFRAESSLIESKCLPRPPVLALRAPKVARTSET